MSNPLLSMQGLPPFQHIKSEHIEPAIDTVLAENRVEIERLLTENSEYTWDNIIQPLEEMDDRLARMWSPVGHMNSVVNSDSLREAYNACLPKLSDYGTEFGQHEGLFKAYQSIADGEEFQHLDRAQRKIIENALRDFHLSGIDLAEKEKNRFKEIKQALSKLTTRYEENLLDATNTWQKHISDESMLAGLPPSALAMAKQTAQQKEIMDGWMFNLEFPSYYAVMTYADNSELRREMYTAYVTRASEQGPDAGKYDNSELMQQIIALRHELANLLGYDNYSERSLVTKMAETPDEVLDFLQNLASRSKPIAEKEIQQLQDFVKAEFKVTTLNAWDLGYYSEKLRQHTYAITQEELKPYFPETNVIKGMFEVVKRLYDIEINQVSNIETWHDDVRFYEITDRDGLVRGRFYLDLYARKNKRGGAWMDDCMARLRLQNGEIQIPVAYLTCNLTPPIGDDPALFTHDEVTTLFHEFGHGLHHMLTKIDHVSVSGINGVAWDAVELPSQFMENWCWEREALDLFARHFKTNKPLPKKLFNRMYAAKNFQSGMHMVRQLEFSIFDFRLHLEFNSEKGARIQQILDEVRDEVAVVKPPEFNRFQHGFSHIFAGGYAAGYYSYKWAEVLSADAFSLFEENGIFDKTTGHAFLTNILELGGSREPMDLFMAFRGRKPEIDALLRHSGIAV